MRSVETGAPIRPERHAVSLAAFIIADLKRNCPKDWALIVSLLGDNMRNAAANDAMRGMLNPSPAFLARRAALAAPAAREP